MATKIAVPKAELIIRLWHIDGYRDGSPARLFFGYNEKLYHFDTHGQVKTNKRNIYNLSQLRLLLRRHKDTGRAHCTLIGAPLALSVRLFTSLIWSTSLFV